MQSISIPGAPVSPYNSARLDRRPHRQGPYPRVLCREAHQCGRSLGATSNRATHRLPCHCLPVAACVGTATIAAGVWPMTTISPPATALTLILEGLPAARWRYIPDGGWLEVFLPGSEGRGGVAEPIGDESGNPLRCRDGPALEHHHPRLSGLAGPNKTVSHRRYRALPLTTPKPVSAWRACYAPALTWPGAKADA